jgi:hypothetical protein
MRGGAGQLAFEGAEDLEREEWITAGRPQEPGEGGPGESDAEPFPDETVECAEGKRWDLEPRDLLVRAELLERERWLRPFASSREDSDGLVLPTPDRVRDESRGRPVKPLEVVDRDQNGRRACEHAYRSERRDGSLPRPGRVVRAHLAAEERDLERVPLWLRQGLEHRVADAREQVDGRAEGEARLELGGRTWYERPCAARSPARQSVVLPIPTAPSNNRLRGPAWIRTTKSSIVASSRSRPITVRGGAAATDAI